MRLQRIGRKNDPAYRVVVTDSRRGPKSAKHVDLLGSYNPKLNQFQVDGERAKDWISKGVQLSDTVHNLLVSQKIIEGKKINVLPRKSPIVKEGEEAEVAKEEVVADATAEQETPKEDTVVEPTPSPKPEVSEAKGEVVTEEKQEEPKE